MFYITMIALKEKQSTRVFMEDSVFKAKSLCNYIAQYQADRALILINKKALFAFNWTCEY